MRGPFSFIDIGNVRYTVDRAPEECPICHTSIHTQSLHWAHLYSNDQDILEFIFQCPRSACGHFFIGRYMRSDTHRQFALYELVPATPPKPQIPPEVAGVSPLFMEVYSQAMAAEAFGLPQLVGIGYRKALEFLIKDYCISKQRSAASKIRSAWLGTCIQQFVEDPKVKLCAERAAWLGNDETHYERRWVNHDIQNLKELIQLTVNWIHSEILTEKYKSDMPTKDPD